VEELSVIYTMKCRILELNTYLQEKRIKDKKLQKE
jgi:hypothetical protein